CKMCGITGFFDKNNFSALETVRNMAAAMPHRGPDGQGEFFQPTEHGHLGFGHRRLSIIDLSQAADQPMHYDGLHIVFNGEIYNYRKIRTQLLKLGHVFSTHSDTEVILHAWREWGEAAIQQWRGFFAFTLYDEHTYRLVAIRARAGVKPYFYYLNRCLFLFGSELKTLMAHPQFPRELDVEAVGSFLQYGCVSSPYCIFKHTKKLPAGHVLYMDMVTQDIRLRQYWNVYDFYNQPKLKIDLPEAISETQNILEEAF